jgi:hypothetical protein
MAGDGKMGKDTGKGQRRRGFLMGAGAAAGAAGAAALALKTRTEPVAGVAASGPLQKDPVHGQGYHETAHIRKYYDTTKV